MSDAVAAGGEPDFEESGLPDLYGMDGLLRPVPDDVTALIEQRRIGEAVVAMQAHGFTITQANATLNFRHGVPYEEAKRAVHFSPAYAPGRAAREALWDELEKLDPDADAD
jgi:hypothetical protein